MENCRAKRISGACALALVASVASARLASIAIAGNLITRPAALRMATSPWILSGREPGVVLGRHDLHAPHVARLVRAIVGDGVVHGADVVPHQHVPLRPLVRMEILLLS